MTEPSQATAEERAANNPLMPEHSPLKRFFDVLLLYILCQTKTAEGQAFRRCIFVMAQCVSRIWVFPALDARP
jgi:hypothetical protein